MYVGSEYAADSVGCKWLALDNQHHNAQLQAAKLSNSSWSALKQLSSHLAQLLVLVFNVVQPPVKSSTMSRIFFFSKTKYTAFNAAYKCKC